MILNDYLNSIKTDIVKQIMLIQHSAKNTILLLSKYDKSIVIEIQEAEEEMDKRFVDMLYSLSSLSSRFSLANVVARIPIGDGIIVKEIETISDLLCTISTVIQNLNEKEDQFSLLSERIIFKLREMLNNIILMLEKAKSLLEYGGQESLLDDVRDIDLLVNNLRDSSTEEVLNSKLPTPLLLQVLHLFGLLEKIGDKTKSVSTMIYFVHTGKLVKL